jgi:hypothetical protein
VRIRFGRSSFDSPDGGNNEVVLRQTTRCAYRFHVITHNCEPRRNDLIESSSEVTSSEIMQFSARAKHWIFLHGTLECRNAIGKVKNVFICPSI